MRTRDYKREDLLGDGILNGLALSVLLHVAAFSILIAAPFMRPSAQVPLPMCVVDLLVRDPAGDPEGSEAAALRLEDAKPEPSSPPGNADLPDEPEPVAEPENKIPDTAYLSELVEPPETPPPVEKKVEEPKEKPKPKPQPKPIRPEKSVPRREATSPNRSSIENGKPGSQESPAVNHDKGIGTENGAGTGLADSGRGSGPDTGGGAGHGPVDASFGSGNGPRFLAKAQPKYPRLARELEKEGTVLLRLTIDEGGRLRHVEVLKRAGSGFDEEAVRAVRDSTFIPAKINGKPLSCRAQLTIRFVLSGIEKD